MSETTGCPDCGREGGIELHTKTASTYVEKIDKILDGGEICTSNEEDFEITERYFQCAHCSETWEWQDFPGQPWNAGK